MEGHSYCLQRKCNYSAPLEFMEERNSIPMQKARFQDLSCQFSNASLPKTYYQDTIESEIIWQKEEMSVERMKTLVTSLRKADLVSYSIEKLLGDFKDSLAITLNTDNVSSLDLMSISKKKDLLWKELETFSDIRRALNSLLEKQSYEKNRPQNTKHLEALMQRILEDEAENIRLKEQLTEKEAKAKDLSHLIHVQKVTAMKCSQLTKTIEATHCRLQNLVQRKETENEQTVTQLKNLEMSANRRRQEIEDLKQQISLSREKQTFDKDGLRKAHRVQRQKADRLQMSIDGLNNQLKEKEIQLSEAISACGVWKTHHDSVVGEKSSLEVQRETLKKQIDNLKNVHKPTDISDQSNEELAEELRVINLENAHYNEENAKLKASIAALENEAVLVNNDLSELQEKANHQKNFVEQYEKQVQTLQLESNHLKERYRTIVSDKKEIIEKKDLETEKTDANDYFLGNVLLELENNRMKKKSQEMENKLDEMVNENQVLEGRLKMQEENLKISEMQLMDKSREYSSLLRLLENAVEEGKKQICAEKENISSSELALQQKLHSLENDLKRKMAKQKQLASTLNSLEKTNDLRLEELKHSLEISENQNQSMNNYVQLLKSFYVTMFE
ncbi:protein BCAP isoform X3 [Bombina bombina]|uniref:protein BCAP isoform X3 n=1 Tax=Bombina bombina TaxID=8345 RepID=UPI00235A8C31|nr:protein BCAP isoform X3 [Bombina bombina]